MPEPESVSVDIPVDLPRNPLPSIFGRAPTPFAVKPPLASKSIQPSIHPLIENHLQRASNSGGRYMVVVFTVDSGEKPAAGGMIGAKIDMARACGANWSYDWLYRAMRMLEEDLRKIEVPGTVAGKAKPTDAAANQGPANSAESAGGGNGWCC